MEGTGGFELAETEAQRQPRSQKTRAQKTRAQKDEHNKICVESRKKKKMRFEELEQTENMYKEMVPEFKRLEEEEVPKLQAENKRANLELQEMESKLRANENELQEAKRNLMAQKAKEELMRGLLLDVIKPNGKSFTSVDKLQEWFVSQTYVPDHQVSATSAILQNVDESVRLGGNGAANFQPSMAYLQMGSGHDYSKNAAYAALGPSSVANPGVMTVPDSSLGGNSVFYLANNPENHVKSTDLYPSQKYVPDCQVSAMCATGLQNVDGFVQSGFNETANFQLSMAYQQMGQDYSNNATYTAVGPSYVANHGKEYNITAAAAAGSCAIANQSLSVVSDTPSTHHGYKAGNHLGVMTVPESLVEYSVSDPSNNLEKYVKGKSYTSVDKFRDLFPSQNYVPDCQVSAVSATGFQNVDGFVQSGLNGTANFQPSMAYQQMVSGQDYSKNDTYTAVGPSWASSVANHGKEYNVTAAAAAGSSAVANQILSVVSDTPIIHHGYKSGNHLGVMTVPESLAEYSMSVPSNNLENYVKSRDLYPSQNYVPDGQVSATSATGFQNVDEFVKCDSQLPTLLSANGSGVLDVASSSRGNPEMLCDPANIHKSNDDLSSRRWY